ncbi:heparan-alpha-glucosaminide N-acetyltransferase isoform X2 [Selaginella moellendorffii]|uniref:heparan-alpha-glucosaminide N-acetyltransferase isoform X2 n=1 Tax=Selaginella moellendorffii TaxID=88036 RepID=UPI000D1C9655|nr:heparan-alpha-glucosaminide N-acetyltransferase isoform X2 [Selaginella moellendorffii]|eukprot:XP_024519084.1 heparan-alpha-glucosaminide N-acetyltransferase isoform X2 [Selaginella moellendorffii]
MGRFGVIGAGERLDAKPGEATASESEALKEPFLVIDAGDANSEDAALAEASTEREIGGGDRPKERLASLDVFRGLSIAMMILVDNAGGEWPAINHSPWNGVTLADLVMPFFLFIVGVALALVYKKIPSKLDSTRKAILRSLKLFFLGVFLQGGYFHGENDLSYGVDLTLIRWCGILQRIAFVYVIVALCEVWLPRVQGSYFGIMQNYLFHWIFVVVTLTVYLSLLYGLKVPHWQFELPNNRNITMTVTCGTRSNLDPACNAVGYVDRQILGVNHLDQQPVFIRTESCSINSPDYGPLPADAPVWCHAPFDPEGILSSVSAIVTCFIGLHYGHFIVQCKEHKQRIINFIVPAVILLALGYVLHLLGIKMNKPLYSFSYMCFTAGAAGAVFCLLYILVDVYDIRYPTLLLEWMGMNSLIIYTLAATDVLVVFIQGFYWKQPQKNLVTFTREHVFFAMIPSQRWAMLVYVLFGICCWCVIAGALKAKGIFWKF